MTSHFMKERGRWERLWISLIAECGRGGGGGGRVAVKVTFGWMINFTSSSPI